MTNSPHVLVLRPIIEEFERRGAVVVVTAREFAQTIPLLERFGIEHTVIGRHRGKKLAAKALGMADRTSKMIAFGRGKGFDLAMSHASNDLPVASRVLGIPHVTMFDYEFARLSHSINVRCSKRVLVPEVISLDVLRQYGCTERKYSPYEGLKEEYYLADFEPDESVPSSLGLDPGKVIVTLRTPPSQAAYHRLDNPLFDDVLRAIAARDDVQAIVLPRTDDQRAGIEAIGGSNIRIPDGVVDAQSLVYYSDVVISGGGTLNREAVALGTPAWTIFKGVMGAVDLGLIAEGRLFELNSAADLRLEKKPASAARVRRDVGVLVDMIAAVAR